MKVKTIAFTLTIILLLFSLGCHNPKNLTNEKPLLLTTVYPYELIVKQLADTLFAVESLLPVNASPHTWSPAPQDLANLDQADLIIANGLGLEVNLDKALQQRKSKLIVVSDLIDPKMLLKDVDGDEDHQQQANPHIWTSPDLLIPIITGLSAELSKRFPTYKTIFESNSRMMIMQINQVDARIRAERDSLPQAAVITLHDAFVYYFRYFKIDFAGAVQPAGGKDPTPKQLKALADTIKQKKIKAIFIEPQMNPQPAKTLASELKLKVLIYDDLGNTLKPKTISEFLWLNWLALKEGL